MLSIKHTCAGDRSAVSAFLQRLSTATTHARYLGPKLFEGLSLEREVRRLQPGNRAHTVLIALEDGQARGIGEYFVSAAAADSAEVALMVEDAYQGRGIGTALFMELERHALGRGIRAFTGEVANDNYRVLSMLRSIDRPLAMQLGYGSTHFEMTLCDCPLQLAA
jgi:GNAT superfamily N-acetyltransferase